jgi:hypothetical protein
MRQDEFVAIHLERVTVGRRGGGGGGEESMRGERKKREVQRHESVDSSAAAAAVGAGCRHDYGALQRSGRALCAHCALTPAGPRRRLPLSQQDDEAAETFSGYGVPLAASSSGAVTPASQGTPGGGSPREGSRSPSSSASLSSPGGKGKAGGPRKLQHGTRRALGVALPLAVVGLRAGVLCAAFARSQASLDHNWRLPSPPPVWRRRAAMQSAGGADAASGSGAPEGGAAPREADWEEGPAGITFAEPVTTPTKDPSRRGSGTSDAKPTLSRVESLSNSFIDDLESDLECSGPGGEDDVGRSSGGGGPSASAGGGRSSGGGGGDGAGDGEELGSSEGPGEIEFEIPQPPVAVEQQQQEAAVGEQQERQSGGASPTGSGAAAAVGLLQQPAARPLQHIESGAAIDNGSSSDLPGIFDIALRAAAGSRASSMDVLAGSVLGGASDVGSERGFCLGLGAGGAAAGVEFASPAAAGGRRPSRLGGAAAASGGGGGGESEAGAEAASGGGAAGAAGAAEGGEWDGGSSLKG